MSTDIHQSELYTKFYDIDLPGGKEWENEFAAIIFSGKIECKRDKLTHKTGNVFIEYQCRGKPSGLSITQANWWAIGIEGQNGDIEVALLVSVPWLKAKCRPLWKTSKDVEGGDDKLSRGILLRLEEFNK
jgi:hypothetical protein